MQDGKERFIGAGAGSIGYLGDAAIGFARFENAIHAVVVEASDIQHVVDRLRKDVFGSFGDEAPVFAHRMKDRVSTSKGFERRVAWLQRSVASPACATAPLGIGLTHEVLKESPCLWRKLDFNLIRRTSPSKSDAYAEIDHASDERTDRANLQAEYTRNQSCDQQARTNQRTCDADGDLPCVTGPQLGGNDDLRGAVLEEALNRGLIRRHADQCKSDWAGGQAQSDRRPKLVGGSGNFDLFQTEIWVFVGDFQDCFQDGIPCLGGREKRLFAGEPEVDDRAHSIYVLLGVGFENELANIGRGSSGNGFARCELGDLVGRHGVEAHVADATRGAEEEIPPWITRGLWRGDGGRRAGAHDIEGRALDGHFAEG